MEFYDKASIFAKEHILPYAEEIDKEGTFPVRSFEKMAEEGFLKMMVPKEYGGDGETIVAHAETCRAFAEACASAALCYMMHNVALNTVAHFGSAELKEKVFGEVVREGKFLGLAYSESGTGTHFYISEVQVERGEGKATFCGRKSMVTSAEHASYFVVDAPSKAEGGIDAWLFPSDASGVAFQPSSWDGMGMRGNVSCPMTIDGVELDEMYRLGGDGEGATVSFSAVVPPFVVGLAAVYSGLSYNMFTMARDHAMHRKYPDGKCLANFETVQLHLSGIYNRAMASAAVTKMAAESFAAGEEDALMKIIAARIHASENVIECGRMAMRVGGGKAYNKETGIERLVRDAYAGQIMAPSVDVLNVWLGKLLTDQPIP